MVYVISLVVWNKCFDINVNFKLIIRKCFRNMSNLLNLCIYIFFLVGSFGGW